MKPVNVISKRAIREFGERHPDSRGALEQWFKVSKAARWSSPIDVRKQYATADAVPPFTVFDICGNKYRLIAEIVFARKMVLVRKILTHADYDRGAWKK